MIRGDRHTPEWYSGTQSAVVGAVVVLLLLLAGIGLLGVAGAAETVTDEPAVAYAEGESGTVSFVTASGAVIETGVAASFVGPVSDYTDDGSIEVVVIQSGDDGAGDLVLVDTDGSTTTLDGSGNAGSAGNSLSALTVGDVDNDETLEVLYPKNDGIAAAEPNGSTRQLTGTLGDGVDGVLGYGQFDGDGNPDLVFAGASQNLKYFSNYGPDGNFDEQVDLGVALGTSNGMGAGPLTDFDGDGTDRLAIIDGSQELVLVDATGETAAVYDTYQEAAKSQVGAADITGDGTTELVHIDSDSNEIVTVDPLAGGPPQTLTDAEGSPIPASELTGISGTAVGAINKYDPVGLDSAVIADPGDEMTLTFNGSVAVDDPQQAAADLTVTADGTAVPVAGVANGSGTDAVDLTLGETVGAGQTVTLSYNATAESIASTTPGARIVDIQGAPVVNNVSQPASFEVSIADLGTPITAGETLVVDTVVENTGELAATQTVNLTGFDETVVDTATVQLAGGGLTVVTLHWETTVDDAGAGEIAVTSSNDSDTATLEIEGDEPTNVTVATQPTDTAAGTVIGGPPAAMVTDQIGEPLAGATVTVSASPAGGLTGTTEVVTNESGLAVFDDLQLTETGEYTLVFSIESGAAAATTETFSVGPGVVETVGLSPEENQTIVAGEFVEFGATATDAFGNLVTDDDDAFSWQNTTPSGTFTHEQAGTYTVTAALSGVSSPPTTVTVEPGSTETVDISPADDQTVTAGEALTFDAVALDGFGNVITDDDTAFEWTNAGQNGTFSKETAGTYDVTASINGVTAGTTTVTVEPAPAETVELSPVENQTVAPAAVVEFEATAVDAFDNVVEDDNAAFEWENASTTGTFSEETAGTYVVTASIDGVTSSPTAVTVEPGAVTAVTLLPEDDQTVGPGESVAFEATALDSFGNAVETDNAAFDWTGAGPTGVFDQTSAGTYTVTATLSGVTSPPTTVTVEPGSLAAVELSPGGNQTVDPGEVLEFEATAVDAFDNVVEDDNAAFEWENASTTGTFSEETAGTYVVTASIDGVTSSPTTVTVESGTVTTVTLSPGDDQTVAAGEPIAFEATALDSSGNVVEDDNAVFNWTGTGPTGVFNQTGTGTYTVTATLSGVTSSPTTVTVEPGSLAAVELSPGGNQTVDPGEVLEFEATATDAFDNVVEDDDTAFGWENATASGVFSEETPGTYAVTATYQGVTADPTSVTVVSLGSFTVDIQTAPDLVEEQDVALTAEFTNTGGVEATQTVGLEVTGLGSDQRNLTLGPGNTTTETFTVGTQTGDAGTYVATVFTDDDTASTSIEVFELTDVLAVQVDETNGPVVVGNDVEFLLNVTNTGFATGSRTLTIAAGALGSVDVEIEGLDPGETTIKTITVGTASQPADVGEHELTFPAGDSPFPLATVTVNLPRVQPALEPPTDVDGDDRYEDINGGGEYDIFDVQAMFNNLGSDTLEDHVWAYDFDDDGVVDVFDVQMLFEQL